MFSYRYRQLSFSKKLLLHSLLISLITSVSIFGVFSTIAYFELKGQHIRGAISTAERLSSYLNSTWIVSSPEASLEEMSRYIKKHDHVDLYEARLLVNKNPIVLLFSEKHVEDAPSELVQHQMQLTAKAIHYSLPCEIDIGGECELYFQFAPPRYNDFIRENIVFAAFVILATLLVAHLLTQYLLAHVMQPVSELVTTANQISRTQDFTIRARQLSSDEFATLTNVFNLMLKRIQEVIKAQEEAELEVRRLNASLEQKVEIRTRELQRSNHELSEALESLNQTREQLVESEKMASLGGLVAGVAHEINTPLGVSITAASHLNDMLIDCERLFKDNKLKRSNLEQLLSNSQESNQIILKNLERASELVRSFKKLAVDQSNEQLQCFQLHDYLHDILLSLKPTLKKFKIQVSVFCDDDLMVTVYPGAIAQIITNFINNSLIHGFDNDPQREGTIEIEGRKSGDRVTLTYTDSGNGMTPETIKRIFDPFFTTKRHQGGSGLGMHITYNLATQRLGGKIQVESEPEKFTRFTLSFPVCPE
tara:strand:+ start:544 stop:2151 length:1608 start_codon:yes stop_codon:yes gene_type:complete